MSTPSKRWTPRSVLTAAMACSALLGCDLESRSNYLHDVEIAPGKWLTLKEERGKCWFVCEWNGKQVQWLGKRDATGENELPVTLREFNGNLYLIVFNREKLGAFKYVYLKLEGTRFVEIPPAEFPKSIATKNMELGESTRMVRFGIQGELLDTWEVLRKLDVKHPYFSTTHTATIWAELETGKSYEQIKKMSDEKIELIIREYAAKYKPIPLPTLVKEKR